MKMNMTVYTATYNMETNHYFDPSFSSRHFGGGGASCAPNGVLPSRERDITQQGTLHRRGRTGWVRRSHKSY